MPQEMTRTIARPHVVLRTIRSQPHVYSAVCKARLFYSRNIAAVRERILYRKLRHLFSMSPFEQQHCEALGRQGFTVLPEFFNADLVDTVYEKVDTLLKNLEIDPYDAYSVQNKKRPSLEGLTYEELAASEKMISLKDPLVKVRECVPIAFNESILKIITNFLQYIPPIFKPMVVRDFPFSRPLESSNFHRDNDEADSAQFFVYLVDIDDTRGPLVYVPGTNRYDVKSCRPRLSRDLGLNDSDGRISDREMAKYFPERTWVRLRVQRGSVAIIHANGFHKGPSWLNYDDARNNPRTVLRFDLAGLKVGGVYTGQERKIHSQDYLALSPLQRIFARNFTVVDERA
jgi:hypothetical protein